jgi:hypothetical protein
MIELVFKISGVTKAQREFGTEAEASAAAVEAQVQAIPGGHHWDYNSETKTWTCGTYTMQIVIT